MLSCIPFFLHFLSRQFVINNNGDMMIIYIEVVLIINVLINLFTIILIKELLYLRLKKTMILTLFLDSIYMLLYVYGFDISLIKYMIPFIFMFLSFKLNINSYFKSVILYYIFSFLLGGISFTINVSGNNEYILILFIYLLLFFIIYIFFKRKILSVFYEISFIFKDKNYRIKAFFDTGSSLLYKGYPVIVLNKKYHFKIHSNISYEFYTATGINIEKLYLINELKIEKRKIKCYCLFLDISYDAIVGSNVL